MKMSEITRREIDFLREKYEGEALEDAIKRVENGEPLAYVLGEWYFYNETYKVNENVLIPRPETEHLVDWVCRLAKKDGRIADLCTGSGCVAISSLCKRNDLYADLYDISEKALEVARENAERNGVSGRVRFYKLDLLREKPTGKYDLIASNPPYIQSKVVNTLDSTVKDYEPHLALDGGEDGLDFYRRFDTFADILTDGGYLVYEIGYDESEALEKMGYEIKKDYSGNDRIAIKRK